MIKISAVIPAYNESQRITQTLNEIKPFVNEIIVVDDNSPDGTGDVLEPEGDVIAIGSGGNYALAAAKVLMDTDLSAEEVARKAIQVASDICVFTNNNIKVEKI